MIDYTQFFGHIKDDKYKEQMLSMQEIPYAKAACGAIYGSSEKKQRLILTDAIVKLLGKWPHIIQNAPDCTSFGAANAIHILKAVKCLKGEEEWISTICTECIYGGSRVETGKNSWRNTGGASGAATAQCCKQMGVLHRIKYLDKYDFSVYDSKLAERLGQTGIPDELEPIAKDFTVKTVSLVTDVNVALDLISNFYPLTIASNIGFEGRRDSNGRLLRDSDGCLKRGGSWPHQQCLIGMDLSPRRPKVALANSWPKSTMSGPLDGLSEGCYWIDLDDLELMLSQQDSFVYSDFKGFPIKDLNLRML